MSVVASPPWTPQEDDHLRQLITAGKSVSEIAWELRRTEAAVRHRANKLKILLGKAKPRKVAAGAGR